MAGNTRVDNGVAELSEANSWSYTFEGLNQKEAGVDIVYTVVELDVPEGYEVSYSGDAKSGLKVTNTHTPATTSITVTKEWDDNNNQDGMRDEVEFTLYANGTYVDAKTLAKDGSSVTFENVAVNAAGKPIVYTVKETVIPKDYTSSAADAQEVKDNALTVTNTHTPETTAIRVTKEWVDNDNQDNIRPENVTIQLLADGERKGTIVLTGPDRWTDGFTDLPVYNNGKKIVYTVMELDVPNDYTSSAATAVAVDENGTVTVTNTHDSFTRDITVTKSWVDENNQDNIRADVAFTLYANGKEVGTKTLTAGDTSVSWTGLDVNAKGQAIVYTVKETVIPKDYTSSAADAQTVPDDGKLTVTNTHEIYTRDITVTKIWEDNRDQDKLRADVRITLYSDGKEHSTKTIALGESSVTWEDLPVNDNGKAIVYTVKETSFPDEYTSSASDEITVGEDGLVDVTNTHDIYTRDITVTKSWVDDNNRDNIRADVEITLYADGEEHSSKTIALGESSVTWEDLPVNDNGKAIVYTVKETVIPKDYTSSAADEQAVPDDGKITVTNTHEIYTTSVTVTKVWDDDNNRDGKRPATIAIKLLANGEVVGRAFEIKKDATGDALTFTWEDLPVNDNGKAIEYTVSEDKPEGYEVKIDGDAEKGFTVTNTHEIETTSVTVTKVWDDDDNRDGVRPATIVIKLLADGKETGKTFEIKKDATENDLTYTWTDLPVNDNGKAIEYTVSEEKPEGYEVKIDGDAEKGFTVTNTHEIETTSVTVTKVWDDDDNRDGKRPATIVIKLLANGEVVGRAFEIKKDATGDALTFTWEDLPVNDNGKAIEYTVSEEKPEGYSVKIDGDAEDGFTVTNSYTPGKTSVQVTKVWDDDDNRDGVRPATIVIKLLANGKETGKTFEIRKDAAGSALTYTWTDLNEMENGKAIEYTVSEDKPEGYEVKIDGDAEKGFTVTNTHEIETTSVTVTKVWDDDDNRDGKRPATIVIKLLADGKETGKTFEIKKDATENDLTYTWTDLPVNDNGKAIEYTVSEAKPEGYEVKIDGDAEKGFTVTNTHEIETTSVTVTKVWDDDNNRDGKRPATIVIKLLANGEVVGRAFEIKKDATGDALTFTWEDLPVNDNGKAIEYTVSEEKPEGYSVKIDGDAEDGFTVTNSYTPGKTSVQVTKVWEDNDNQDGIRPASVTVKLLADGVDTGKTIVLSKDNRWTDVFDGLDEYEAGKKVVYTIAEVKVDSYETKITGDASTGFTVTNTHKVSKISIDVTKTWDDADNQDNKRPESITIRLLADGTEVAFKEITADEEWKWTFEGLDEFKAGEKITYTITEDTVKDYTSKIEGFNVTNSYTPGKTSVQVTKVWEDNGNQDGVRPAGVTVKLLADGVDTGKTVVLNKDNSWTDKFDDLDEYKAGKKIAYTIAEVKVDSYETKITGDAETGFTVTNTHTSVFADPIKVNKIWNDDNDRDGKRPDKITVRLYADGVEVAFKEVTLVEGGWKCDFTDVPKYRPEGILIKYEIKEDPVEEYSSEITGNAEDGFTITNSYTPGRTSLKVVKVWDDGDNEVGVRDDIGVTLYANGVQVGEEIKISYEVNEYTWTDLLEYENGEKIVYTVKETTVPEYYQDSTAEKNAEFTDGIATITNLLELDGPIDDPVPLTGLIKFKMQKEWLDLPGSKVTHDEIQVKIYRDGVHLTTAILNEESGWIYEWSANKEYTWTYEEVQVPGYVSTVETVKISDKQYSVVITNKADGYDTPDTGDNTVLFGALAGAAVVGMAIIPAKIRRRREDEAED